MYEMENDFTNGHPLQCVGLFCTDPLYTEQFVSRELAQVSIGSNADSPSGNGVVGPPLGPATRLTIAAAPVSLQKGPEQSRTNASDFKRKLNKYNKTEHYPAAHNGLVAGSSPAGPTKACLSRVAKLESAAHKKGRHRFSPPSTARTLVLHVVS